MTATFSEKVREIVKGIPSGKTMTYKQVAIAAGHPRAYRCVGTILSKNYDPEIPCHRVIRSDGKWGEYNRGDQAKRMLLKSEGVREVQ